MAPAPSPTPPPQPVPSPNALPNPLSGKAPYKSLHKNDKESVSLYAQAKVGLLRLLMHLSQQGVERLPAENDIATQLAVSRAVIRDVLAELETRGYVTRKRGVGTLINPHIFTSHPRVDEQVDFDELIRSAGHEPSCVWLADAWTRTPEPGILDHEFTCLADESLLQVERVFQSNGTPVIYSRAYIRESAFHLDYSRWQGYRELSIFEFLETFCHKQVSVTLAELHIHLADAFLAAQLQVAENAPLLLMRDTGYTAQGEAIVRACAFLCPQILPVKLVRHRI